MPRIQQPGCRILGLLCLLLAFIPEALARDLTKREEDVTAFLDARKETRFTRPWPALEHIPFPSLEESRHRVFFSSVKRQDGDGLGHSFSTKNKEIFTARLLGLSYTHRKPLFGSLSPSENEDVMEDFFGWGKDEIDRDDFQAENCHVPIPPVKECARCGKPRGMYKIVQIPFFFSEVTYIVQKGFMSKVRDFVASHNNSHTIFHLDELRCLQSPTLNVFELTTDFFRYKYWKRHSVPTIDFEKQAYHLYGRSKSELMKRETLALSADLRDLPLNFNDQELTIAVHVRRGDFFQDTKRVSLKSAVYAQIIRTVQDVVEEAGGPFQEMKTAVYIYSEGRQRGLDSLTQKPFAPQGHNMTDFTPEYVDENMVVRDAKWWQELIASTAPQESGRPEHRSGKMVQVPRVELRVSRKTVQSLHQMTHADIFIGSVSGLSTSLVRNLARGVQIHPTPKFDPASEDRSPRCEVKSDIEVGQVDRRRLVQIWERYRKDNEYFLR